MKKSQKHGVHTEQKQLHFSGWFLSVFTQVFINHFTPLHRSFVLGADRAAHFYLGFSLANHFLASACGLSSSWVERGETRCLGRGELNLPSRRSQRGEERSREGEGDTEWGERRWQRRLVSPAPDHTAVQMTRVTATIISTENGSLNLSEV